MPKPSDVKDTNVLLEEQETILRRLAEIERQRVDKLTGTQKETAQLKERLKGVNDELTKSKDTAGSLGQAFEGMIPMVGSFASSVTSQMLGALTKANAQTVEMAVNWGRVDMSQAVSQQTKFLEVTTRGAIASGQSLDGLRAHIDQVADSTHESRDGIVDMAKGIADVSGTGLNNALTITERLAQEAKDTGQAFGEMGDLGATLAPSIKSAEDLNEVLTALHGQAEQLKTVGGVKALEQQLAALGTSVNGMSPQKIIATMAALGEITKGMAPQQAKETQAKVIAGIKSQATRLQREGVDVYDQNGQFDASKIPAAVEHLKKYNARFQSTSAGQERLLAHEFGEDAGLARRLARADTSTSHIAAIARIRSPAELTGLHGSRGEGAEYDASDAGRDAELRRREERTRITEAQRQVIEPGRQIRGALADQSSQVNDIAAAGAGVLAHVGVDSQGVADTVTGKRGTIGNSTEGLAALIGAINNQKTEIKIFTVSDKPTTAVVEKKSQGAGQ